MKDGRHDLPTSKITSSGEVPHLGLLADNHLEGDGNVLLCEMPLHRDEEFQRETGEQNALIYSLLAPSWRRRQLPREKPSCCDFEPSSPQGHIHARESNRRLVIRDAEIVSLTGTLTLHLRYLSSIKSIPSSLQEQKPSCPQAETRIEEDILLEGEDFKDTR